jgi:hypothetical protein
MNQNNFYCKKNLLQNPHYKLITEIGCRDDASLNYASLDDASLDGATLG